MGWRLHVIDCAFFRYITLIHIATTASSFSFSSFFLAIKTFTMVDAIVSFASILSCVLFIIRINSSFGLGQVGAHKQQHFNPHLLLWNAIGSTSSHHHCRSFQSIALSSFAIPYSKRQV
ncbi:hypothetical protein V1517DRAFT_61864 [Lipomyces orientalis]|uniref:Uncharacterized protein n=1 Tax=Lipomyces orientalis TaxID=1233043 RepID=A0ACC3TSH9_9ASCO